MYDTTYCTRRVVGDLVMRDLKTESRDTVIALDLISERRRELHIIYLNLNLIVQ